MNIETNIKAPIAASHDFVAEFLHYLGGKKLIRADVLRNNTDVSGAESRRTLRQVWESSDMPAHDFADHVAAVFGLRRMSLPDLIGATALTARFSQRFLREAAIFPFEHGKGRFGLALGDPGDIAACKAAELVLGGQVDRVVASFEDIATALAERLGPSEDRPADAQERPSASADESIDILRDLASGAPATSISSRSAADWRCACGWTACCAPCRRRRRPCRKP